MKLACVHTFYRLIKIVEVLCGLILVEDFLVLGVHIEPFSQLEAVVLANTINFAVL
jgi:hypothetical protein